METPSPTNDIPEQTRRPLFSRPIPIEKTLEKLIDVKYSGCGKIFDNMQCIQRDDGSYQYEPFEPVHDTTSTNNK